MAKLNKKQIIIISIISVLIIAAIVVAIVVSSGNSEPAISDSTGETTKVSETEKKPDNKDEDKDTQKKEEENKPTEFLMINPLTGEEATEETYKKRPAAFMVSNIKEALPQHGVSKADVLYECLVEGGITRLLMLIHDYESINILGSIRSSRDYYLDLVQNHDAFYFHWGWSDQARKEIPERGIDNFNATNMYRDSWRKNTLGELHAGVITGEGALKAIQDSNKRTELKEDFEYPFNFAKEVTVPNGEIANCVYLPFSGYQAPYLKYDETTNTYKRWQFGKAHIDKDTNTQLEFTNIIVLFCPHTGVLDASKHIDITTTGTGEGYYISNGKCINIQYTKETVDSQMHLFNTDGTPLEINVGKSYIAIMKPELKADVNLNYNK